MKKFKFSYRKHKNPNYRILKFDTEFMKDYSDSVQSAFIAIFFKKIQRANLPLTVWLDWDVEVYAQELVDKINSSPREQTLIKHHLRCAVSDYMTAPVFHIHDHDTAILALEMLKAVDE
jgi:hypothetical protein